MVWWARVTLFTWLGPVTACLNFRWFTDTFSNWCNFVCISGIETFIWCIGNDVIFQCLWRHNYRFKPYEFYIVFVTCTCAPPLWKRFRHPCWQQQHTCGAVGRSSVECGVSGQPHKTPHFNSRYRYTHTWNDPTKKLSGHIAEERQGPASTSGRWTDRRRTSSSRLLRKLC